MESAVPESPSGAFESRHVSVLLLVQDSMELILIRAGDSEPQARVRRAAAAVFYQLGDKEQQRCLPLHPLFWDCLTECVLHLRVHHSDSSADPSLDKLLERDL